MNKPIFLLGQLTCELPSLKATPPRKLVLGQMFGGMSEGTMRDSRPIEERELRDDMILLTKTLKGFCFCLILFAAPAPCALRGRWRTERDAPLGFLDVVGLDWSLTQPRVLGCIFFF